MTTQTRPDVPGCTVPRCGRPVEDATLCHRCTDHLERALAEVPWLTEQLEITVTRAKAQTFDGGSRSAERPLPYHLKASEAATGLSAALRELAAALRVAGELATAPHAPIPLSRALLGELKAIRRNNYGPTVDTITRTHRTAMRIIDRPAEKVYAGPCECGEDLYAKKAAAEVACRGCDRTYDVAEMQEWMKSQVADRLVTAREGAGLLSRFDLPTEQKTIDKWHERNRVTVRGHNPRGRRMYLFADLLTLAANVKRP